MNLFCNYLFSRKLKYYYLFDMDMILHMYIYQYESSTNKKFCPQSEVLHT
jgi:hypothetical protein